MSHWELQLPCGGGDGGDVSLAESSIVTRGIPGRCPLIFDQSAPRYILYHTITNFNKLARHMCTGWEAVVLLLTYLISNMYMYT